MVVSTPTWLRSRLLVAAAVSTAFVANTLLSATPAAAAGIAGQNGHDLSIPQCSQQLPAPERFAVVGVNGGVAFSGNPCLSTEYAWAARARVRPQLYMNLGDPGAQSPRWGQAGARACAAADRICLAGNYGANAATDALARAAAVGAHSRRWWLDIETANSWAADAAQNVAVIQGAAGALRARGATVGIYSTGYQWRLITGGWQVAMPNWLGGAASPAQAASWCSGSGFSGGAVQLVQYPTQTIDGDLGC
jgi:hypothetical protein